MAKPEAEVQRELLRLNLHLTDRKLRALAANLMDSEVILSGWLGHPPFTRDSTAVITTDRRVIGMAEGSRELGGLFWLIPPSVNYSQVDWTDIARVEVLKDAGWRMRVVGYGGSGEVDILFGPIRKQAEFMQFMQEIQERVRAVKASPDLSESMPGTVPDQLERLAALWEDGSLTDSEFAAAKRKLLGTS